MTRIGQAFHLKLLRTKVGSEKELMIERASEPNQKGFYFKILGNYDLLEISPVEELHQATRAISDPRILNYNSLLCICRKDREQKFFKSLKEANAPLIILIKVQDEVFLNQGLNGLYQVADRFCSLRSGTLALIGLGYYEIVLWVPGRGFEQNFKFVDKIRKMKISDIFQDSPSNIGEKGLLTSSITIPTISYANVILPQKYENLQGKITPIMNIKCAPGFEKAIAQKTGTATHLLWGVDDLLCVWKKSVRLRDLVPLVLRLREEMKNFAVTDTVTKIASPKPISLLPEPDYSPPASMAPQHIIPNNLAKLESMLYDNEERFNKALIGEILNTYSLINTYIGNRTMGESAYEIPYSMELYLTPLVEEYAIAAEQKDKRVLPMWEGALFLYLNYIRTAAAQQFSTKGYSDYYEGGMSQAFASSLAPIIKAMSVIPEQLFKVISVSDPPLTLQSWIERDPANEELRSIESEYHYPWNGFLVLDFTEGYKIDQPAEIIVAPYKDIFYFLDWITLSHEISHGYYVRIAFEKLESDYLDRTLPHFYGRYFSGKPLEVELVHYNKHWKNSVNELFSHWFDYRHFFDGDLDFYLWSIWRTYLDIPRVLYFKTEYWTRSLFVALCHDWEATSRAITKIYQKSTSSDEYKNGLVGLFAAKFRPLYQSLLDKFKERLHPFKLEAGEIEDIAGMLIPFFDLARIFEEKYVNPKIREGINGKYPRLPEDLKAILSGNVVIDPIPNSFLLLREIVRRFYLKGDFSEPSKNVTLAFILSLWETSRRYRRN